MKRRKTSRRDDSALFVRIGIAVLMLVAVVGYVSFTALDGLPLQERRRLSVEILNANRLIAANDVRIAGVRVGQVTRVAAQPPQAGRPAYARLDLELEASVAALAVNTAVRVRPASVLGANYVELIPGSSEQIIPDGGTLGLERSIDSVELTDLFDVFDREAARSFRSAVTGFSGGLVGRGAELNVSIEAFARLMGPLANVAAAVASPAARFDGFLSGYTSVAGELEPVSSQLAGLMAGGNATFRALAGERAALAAMLDAAPPAQAATTDALTRVQPALRDLVRLTTQLRPAVRRLGPALQRGNRALAAGVLPLRQLPGIAPELRATFATLDEVSRLDSTSGALRKTADLMRASDRSLAILAPAQTQCNVVALLGQNYSAFTGTLGFGHGPSFWNLPLSTPGSQTGGLQSTEPAPDLGVNYTPNMNASECEAGNEPDPALQQRLDNPPGLQAASTRDTSPPPGVRERAQAAGLIVEGTR